MNNFQGSWKETSGATIIYFRQYGWNDEFTEIVAKISGANIGNFTHYVWNDELTGIMAKDIWSNY